MVTQATASPSKLESQMDVLTAEVAKLTTTTDQSRQKTKCGGKCYYSASCKAMGKTCNKCYKLTHFGNRCKCKNNKVLESRTLLPQQYQGYWRQGLKPISQILRPDLTSKLVYKHSEHPNFTLRLTIKSTTDLII